MATRPDRKLTYEDYLHFPEGERYELIDGEAWMVPAPNARHQDIAGSYGDPVVMRPPDVVRPLVPSELDIDLASVFRP